MPLGTLDRSAPTLFKQGPSPLSRLTLYSALALFLMVADARFHLAIAEASHNVIMLHMMRSMFELLQEGIFYNRQVMFGQKTTRKSLLAQHGRINDAIQKRDGKAARAAVEDHLRYVRDSLSDSLRAAAHEDVARQRLSHLKAKK